MVTTSLTRTLLLPVILLLAPLHATAQPTRTPIIQSLDIQVPVAPAAINVGGKRHLVYELHVTNFQTVDVALNRVEILNADDGTPLANFSGDELAARLGRPGMRGDVGDKHVIGAGLHAVVYLWLPLNDDTGTPSRLRHSVAFERMSAAGREHGVVETAPLPVGRRSPIVLNAPLRGGPWAAIYDPHMERGHRTSIYTVEGRARIPARFAIDWIRLEADGSRARGDGSRITDWHGYGAEVLAVADAIVADARDDMPEAELVGASLGRMPLENASGNYVVLDLGDGRYAFYEHLKHGSVRVKTGERVASGDVIGLLGNSGSSSSGPHLHFHVADGNSTLGSEGLPWVLGHFEALGAFESIGAYARSEPWKPAPQDAGGARHGELPAANAVVTFDPNE